MLLKVEILKTLARVAVAALEACYFAVVIEYNVMLTRDFTNYDAENTKYQIAFPNHPLAAFSASMGFTLFLFCLIPSTVGAIYYALRCGKTVGARKVVATVMTVCHAAALAYPLIMIALLMTRWAG
jgi:dihydrodipicolinate synthase/N-acetylneuraminate lyase